MIGEGFKKIFLENLAGFYRLEKFKGFLQGGSILARLNDFEPFLISRKIFVIFKPFLLH